MTTNASFSVEGKRALVTGGGSGINLCFVSLLLSKGCSVVIADLALRPESQKLLDEYSSSSARVIFQKTDVTDWKQLQTAFDVCVKELGGIDICCPGAGIFEPPWSNFWFPPGSDGSKDAIDANSYKTLDINITHPIRATQLAISHFLNPSNASDKPSAQNPKRVVHLSSIAGQAFGLTVPLYFTSKHAISAFVRSMGELDPNLHIRVNAAAPGAVLTPLWTESVDKIKWMDKEKDKWITPEEVAEAMLRLMVDEELVGGTILEIGKGHSRVVPAFNNPGPDRTVEGMGSSNAAVSVEEAYRQLGEKGWGMRS